jgi:hypothetical protein
VATISQPALDPDELDLIRHALAEWSGPAHSTDDLARAMGFADTAAVDASIKPLLAKLNLSEPLLPHEWLQLQLATEFIVGSDIFGSGVEWPTTSGLDDAVSIGILRNVQRKLIRFRSSPSEISVLTFAGLARRWVEIIDGDIQGLELLVALRRAMTLLYAGGLQLPERPEQKPTDRRVRLTPEAKQAEVVASLEARLPPEMYWSTLLPLTYLTVGNAGVMQFADELREIYANVEPGLELFDDSGITTELVDWWSDSDYSWGPPTIRCIHILHEVIVDLRMNLYATTPPPTV